MKLFIIPLSLKTFALVFFSTICIFFTSCHKENSLQLNSECAEEAFYRGINVCHSGENAAAIELENNTYLILPNFFELVDIDSIQYDDLLYVEFDNVDSSLYNSGALCGAMIVAPIANLTCIFVP